MKQLFITVEFTEWNDISAFLADAMSLQIVDGVKVSISYDNDSFDSVTIDNPEGERE